MIQSKKNKNGGFIKMIILIIVIIATLSYFKIDIASVVESKPVQAIWGFTKTLVVNYIKPSIGYVWDGVLKDFIFNDVVNFFTTAQKQISSTNIEDIMNSATSSPKVN